MKYATCMLALVALVLGGCGHPNPPTTGDNTAKMELRVYQVPPEHTQDLKYALQTNFQAGSDSKTPIGSVSSPAPGQLLVLAPSSLQDSIGSSLKSLSGTTKSTTPATPPMQIRLQFWSVDAIAGAGTDDAELSGLSEALTQTRKSLGVVHFVLRDHVSAVSGIDQSVAKSWFSTLNKTGQPPQQNQPIRKTLTYNLQPASNGLNAQIQFVDEVPVDTTPITYQSTKTVTNAPIHFSQTLVLAQSPIANDTNHGKAAPSMAIRLYIVRADQVPAA